MKSNPTALFLLFMFIGLIIVAGYLIVSNPMARSTTTKTDFKMSQQKQNQPALALYMQNCARCHGAFGQGKSGNPSLQNTPFSEEQIQQIIRNGRGEMPPFRQFSADELKLLSGLVKQF